MSRHILTVDSQCEKGGNSSAAIFSLHLKHHANCFFSVADKKLGAIQLQYIN